MELWERIVKANNEIKTINLKGKEYAEVKERILAFRKVYPDGEIYTDVNNTENYIMVKAYVYGNNGTRLATGHARELANKPFALENAETSAIGRAIGIATGLGISTSLASFEEMQNYEDSKVFDDEQIELNKKRREEANAKFNKLSVEQKAQILNLMHKKSCDDIEINTLEDLLRNAK